MTYSIVLDDDIEYLIVDEEVIDGIEYTLFSNINNEADICFRKTIVEDGEEYYALLDDKKEYEKVLLHFSKKNFK